MIMTDNKTLYDICCRNLDIEHPIYSSLNHSLAQIISWLRASLRFDGVSNDGITEFHINIMPQPSIYFMLSRHTLTISAEKAHYEQLSVAEITMSVFAPFSMMIKCDPRHDKCVACYLMYRGDNVPKDVNTAVANIKTKRINGGVPAISDTESLLLFRRRRNILIVD